MSVGPNHAPQPGSVQIQTIVAELLVAFMAEPLVALPATTPGAHVADLSAPLFAPLFAALRVV